MKENLRLISCFSVALLIYSFILSPTLGRKNRRTFNGGQKSISTPTSTNTQLADPPKDGVQELVISGQSVQSKRQDPELSKLFRDYDLIRLDPRAAAAQVRNTGRLLLKTSRRNFDLKMALNDMRAPDYVSQAIGSDGVPRQLPKLPVNTYKGVVRGIEGGQARMAVKEGSIEGAIITEGERYFVQPARSLSRTASADEFVFYRGSDVINEGSTCGVTLADEVAAQETRASSYVNEATAEAAGPITPLSPLKIARLATDADAEYVSALGGAAQANAQIASIMNLVDGIYQVEIGVTFQIAFQNTWTDAATDPYVSTNPSTLLGQFRSHWNTNFTNIDRSLAHLWTGKDLDSGVVGVASLAVVCRFPQSAYGLSQRFPFDPSNPVTAQTVVLTAHEMGHNFSALHTNAPDGVPPDIEQPCDNTIMEASVGPGSSFCTFSRSQIIGHANAYASCFLDSSVPAPSPSCVETPINTSGVNTNGTLSNSDCGARSRGVRFFADQYSFNATVGQQVTITMNGTSGDLDPYLYLIGPDGYVVTQDDDSNGNNNSRIPGTSTPPTFTLPLTGKYIIEATSFSPQQTGDYTMNVTFNGCTLSVSPASAHFPAAGGTGTINVTVSGPCDNYTLTRYPHTEASQWVLPHEGGGSGSRALNFSVTASTNVAGRRAFLLVGPSGFNSEQGGIRIPITQSGTGPDCSLTPIASGQTINGDLSTSDCQSPVRGNGFYTDRYVFDALAGQQIAITLSSANAPTTDTFLTLMGPNGVVILTDDDSGGLTNSRLPGGTGSLTLGLPGTYIIEASTFDNGAIGPYTLTLTSDAEQWEPVVLTANQVEIKTWTIGGRAYAYLKLSFQNAGYRVVDWGQPVRAGNDFTADAAVERFTGASVQAVTTTAQIYDLGPLADGNYTFTFKNSGTVVKSQAFTVSSATPPPNPIDDAREFVRQQYRDFLNREADQAGEDFWTDNITKCSDPARRPPDQMGQTEEQCTVRQRETTSGAFFLSPEFQYTGYYVYRMYQGALGRQPKLSEFTPDAQFVGAGIIVNGQLSAAKINQNKADFAQQFVNCTDAAKYRCSEFKAIYDGLNNQQYVDKLFQNTGAFVSDSDKAALVSELNANPATGRASVLQKVVDGIVVIAEGNQQFTTSYGQEFYNSESNRAFVQLEYFGYMKRDPDDAGYAHWLGKLNQYGNFVDAEMVLAFISSPEYRARFGQP